MNQIQVLETPIKSEGDKKSYRLIKLRNGLKALLIMKAEDSETNSNENTENIVAAQLSVNVGSFDDPPNAMGLAHFLEHMLCMGSKKYPEDSSFNDFLAANGGSNNAITTSEYTVYFFNISEKAFPEALDIFAHQFIDPLLHKGTMQREREAVDSEYQMSTSNDFLLIEYMYKNLIYETHPASQLDCGNLESLRDNISDDDLHAELLKLHAKYVANKMYLAVQSSRGLDELQEIVVKRFSGVKSGDPENENLSPNPPKIEEIFKPEFYNKIYFMKPTSARKALLLNWTLPSIQKFYKCSPFDFIAHIFINEGEGGLSNYLKEKLLITSLSFYVHENSFGGNSQFCLPRLIVNLTDAGLESIEQVLDAIFSYLLMIKDTSIEDLRRLYNELKERTEISFKYHTEKSALSNVRDLITPMMKFEDCDILRGTSLYQIFDEKVITESISSLNERKFNLLIVDDDHEALSKKEKYFDVEYDDQDFPEAYQKLWNERKRNPDFFLEKPNPFIAKNFEIFIDDEEFAKFPKKIFEDDIYEVWHKLDAKFKAPRATISIQILSPNIMNSVESYIYLNIFERMLDRHLKKSLSQASIAGLNLHCNGSDKAFSMSFSGFNDKMETFFEMVIKGLIEYNEQLKQPIFEAIRMAMKKGYFNRLLHQETLCSEILKETVIEKFYSIHDIYKALDNLSFEKFKKFVTTFFAKIRTQVLIQGNMTKSQGMKILGILQTNLRCEPLDEEYELKDRCYQIPTGRRVLRIKSLMLNNDNSSIKHYYQIGRDTLRARCLTRLIASILDTKAFDYLRSKEQLGYSVGCKFIDDGGILALQVHVASQERKHAFTEVAGKMETFMSDVATKTIEELTDEDFENFRESRVKLLSSDIKSLADETKRNWFEIQSQDYVFDRYELAANVTKNLSKKQLQDFFTSFTQPEGMRRLSVLVTGNQQNDGGLVENGRELKIEFMTEKLSEENIITNIEEFQSELLLNPVAKFQI